jgi:hypothetical protein
MGWTGPQSEDVATKECKTTDKPQTTANIGYDKLLRRYPMEIVSIWEPKFGSRTSGETAEDLVNCF